MKIIFFKIFLFFSFAGFQLFGQSIEIFSSKDDPWVEEILSRMTLEEKAGQLVFPHAYGDYMSIDSPDYLRLERLVKDLKVGGIIFFLSNIYEQAVITNKLQELASVPLLISADFERGVAQRTADATLFPYNMAVGAADDTELTYRMGRVIAAEGRAIGVHQNYAPVSDVNNNPLNPIINVRSFGEDVELVKRHSNAFLKGVQDGKMIATAKHFPGHGNTNIDSHLSLPLIEGNKDELLKTELAPFISNIENGVMSVMIGHLEVPALEDKKALPSTLSKRIVTNLLKDELSFKGLIVTDAMNMHAVTDSFTAAEAAVLALNAGNDAILFPKDAEESIYAIIQAVRSGDLSEERLDQSIRKILLLKKSLRLDKQKLIDINNIANIVGTASHWQLAQELASKSITLVKDDSHLLPLSSNGDKKLVRINILDSRSAESAAYFNRLLKERINSLDIKNIFINSNGFDAKEALEAAESSDQIILSVYLKVKAYSSDLGLTQLQMELIKRILNLNKPAVMISHGNPYLLSLFPEIKTYVCSYGDSEVSEAAAVRAILGESLITGKLPVSIPNTEYKFGHGLRRNQSALADKNYFTYGAQSKKFSKVDSVVQSAIRDSAFPGAVVLIAKDGKILYEKSFGHLTYNFTSPKVETNTIFDLASVSKVIATTTAAMICLDEGLFKLDDAVSNYIPSFAENNKGNITIRNLLEHNSGLPAWRKFYAEFTTADEVLSAIYSSRLEYETGTKMVYSDLGMITLGKIIEKVSGSSLYEFCRKEIFIPLGMMSTLYNPPSLLKNKIAPTELDNYWRMRQLQGEVHDETAAVLNGIAGHAGLFSTAKDLAVLLQMLLQKGTYQGKEFIKKETVELFTKKQSALSTRGLGWDTKSKEGSSAGDKFNILSYGHTGYTGTSVWTDPTRNLIVVFLTNRVYPSRNNLKISSIRPKLHNAVIDSIEK